MATRRKSSFTPQLVIRFIISASLIVYLINMIDWKVALEMIKEGSLFYFTGSLYHDTINGYFQRLEMVTSRSFFCHP